MQRNYLSQIFKAYNQAKAIARRAGDLKCIERLNKALGILMSTSYYQDQKAAYQPTSASCNCKDWEFRHAARRQYSGPCKHMHAEALMLTASTNFLFTQSRTHVSIMPNVLEGAIPGNLEHKQVNASQLPGYKNAAT